MTNRTRYLTGALCLGTAAALYSKLSRRISFEGRSVLITGGSRGLGLLIAREFAKEGAHVTIVARDEAELNRAADDLRAFGGQIHIEVADIAQRDEAESAVRAVLAREGHIDVLINNAGQIRVGPLEHMDENDFVQAMAVHFWGPLHTMTAAIPAMRRAGFGRVVNISSIGGSIGVPHLAPYSASKFALTGLSDAVRAEVAKDGIRVTTVLPGLMRTGSPFNASFKGRHREEFTWFTIADSLPLATVSGERAARQIVQACRYGRPNLVIGWPFKLAIVANALAPSMVSALSELATRLVLPGPASTEGNTKYSGWQSRSKWAPSRLTRLTERAAAANNEVL
jgi:NAD(P)-dependent dehydrogenase (short-subunit alcohol dehydrogenase family)